MPSSYKKSPSKSYGCLTYFVSLANIAARVAERAGHLGEGGKKLLTLGALCLLPACSQIPWSGGEQLVVAFELEQSRDFADNDFILSDPISFA